MGSMLRLLLALLIADAGSGAGARAAEPLAVARIADGVYVHVAPYELANPANGGDIGNCGFIVGERSVAVIDSCGSLLVGQRLLASIRAVTDRPIAFLVNTHVHPDHLLGNAAFAGTGARIVGNARLPDALAARADAYLAATRRLVGDAAFAGTRVVPPDLLVDGSLELDLGGRTVLAEAWPTAHTNSDLTVLDRKTGTWFLGDLLFADHLPALDGSLKGWLAVLDAAMARTAARAVPGHGPASMAWPAAAVPERRYLDILREDVRRMIREGIPIGKAGVAAQVERNHWQLFDDFNPRNAVVAYHELEWE